MPDREGLEPGSAEEFGLVFLEAAAVGISAFSRELAGVGAGTGSEQLRTLLEKWH